MSSPDFTLPGKTALITGGGSGIGLAFATLLLSHSVNVVIADLSLRPEAQSLISSHKDRAIFVETDVTSWPALQAAFDTTLSNFGGLDILVPAAGIYEPRSSAFFWPPGCPGADDPEGGRYKLIDINVTHPVRATQMALGIWNADPGRQRRVVHTASVAGLTPGPGAPLYHASKHAIVGLVKSLGPLEAVGVRVTAVAPGLIRTQIWFGSEQKTALTVEDGSWVEADEVAAGMLELVTGKGWSGGDIMEITRKGVWRKVAMFNDPGPPVEDLSGYKGREHAQEALGWMKEPGWGLPAKKG